ncbi:hypothetical protein [Saccharibacillus alkalitolerans]|uniref:Uncharacterized protein n=1 Tax=Saccharibacillus alkalitolerans TaxID=2705290 RepID=A0ABX0F1W0_9BACL|nr:hypothetical protein [Saccharibacillus alkalitolerans]NGZ74963.1 hypothetical protein [Saccharibacillus alkalitolerans]
MVNETAVRHSKQPCGTRNSRAALETAVRHSKQPCGTRNSRAALEKPFSLPEGKRLFGLPGNPASGTEGEFLGSCMDRFGRRTFGRPVRRAAPLPLPRGSGRLLEALFRTAFARCAARSAESGTSLITFEPSDGPPHLLRQITAYKQLFEQKGLDYSK